MREAARQAMRPPPAERGYDRDWQVVRAAHLAEFPTCSVEGCGRPATDVDHIESIADVPHRRLDRSNLRSMCHSHHAQRTAREQSFKPVQGERGVRHPEWLKPAIVPLTLVCGPPASGRSTWVGARAGPRDMVLDMAEIAQRLSGFPLYEAPRAWTDVALRWRNSRLQLLSLGLSRWPSAWLIAGEAQAEWRQWWRGRGAKRVVVIETPLHDCLQRIEAADRPAIVKQAQAEAVRGWWLHYERADDDMIVLPDRVTTARALSIKGHGGWSV